MWQEHFFFFSALPILFRQWNDKGWIDIKVKINNNISLRHSDDYRNHENGSKSDINDLENWMYEKRKSEY